MEIAPGVHAVRLRSGYVFVINEPQMTLIDAGLTGSRRPVERYLHGIGRSLDDIGRIICTHAHPDHIGGVRELADDREVEVLMHPADLAGLNVTLRDAVANRNRGQLIAYFTRHPGVATPVEDGQVLPILCGLPVVHTPGLPPACICLLRLPDPRLSPAPPRQVGLAQVSRHAPLIRPHPAPPPRSSDLTRRARGGSHRGQLHECRKLEGENPNQV